MLVRCKSRASIKHDLPASNFGTAGAIECADEDDCTTGFDTVFIGGPRYQPLSSLEPLQLGAPSCTGHGKVRLQLAKCPECMSIWTLRELDVISGHNESTLSNCPLR